MKEKNTLVTSLRRVQKAIEKPLRLKELPYCYDYPVSPYMRIHYHRDIFEKAHLSFQKLIQQAMEGTFDEASFGIAMDTMSVREGLECPIVLDRPSSSVSNVILFQGEKQKESNPYFDIQEIIPDWFTKLGGLYQYSIPVQTISSPGDTVAMFSHNRREHSFDVAINMEIVLRRNNLDEQTVRQGILTGLLHDVSTPLYGDIAMQAFPDLSEEKTFKDYMKKKANLALLQEKYHLDVNTLERWIQNKEWMGELLDICDRLGYTMRDSYYYGTDIFLSKETSQTDEEASLRHQSFLLPGMHVDPLLFDIITEIKIIEHEGRKRVVFLDPDRLSRVLFLRAHMIKELYKNPFNWGRELYMGKVLEFLIEKGLVYLKDLSYDRSPQRIEKAMGVLQDNKEIPQDPLSLEQDFFCCELFDTMEEVQTREKEIQQFYSEPMPFFVIPFDGFQTGTSYLVYDKNKGQVLPLEKSRPDAHAFLEQAKEFSRCVALYYPRKKYEKGAFQSFTSFLKKTVSRILTLHKIIS